MAEQDKCSNCKGAICSRGGPLHWHGRQALVSEAGPHHEDATLANAQCTLPKLVEVKGCHECRFQYENEFRSLAECGHPDAPSKYNVWEFYMLSKAAPECPLRKRSLTLTLVE